MKTLRIALAACAAAALLGLIAVIALAAPASLVRSASPANGAGRAVYCPTIVKKQRKAAIAAYRRRLLADRARFFASHRSRRERAAFVKLQRRQVLLLQRRLKQCV
ncbi:MAG: hypothetical protein ABR569_01200 [Gaiellaceae bacterium]